MKTNLAIFDSHDSSVAVRADDGSYHVIELERLAKERYFSLMHNREKFGTVMPWALEIAREWATIDGADYLSLHPKDFVVKELERMGHKAAPGCNHHDAHAACAFFQSPFRKATVISFDGGGHDMDGSVQYFCCYDATRKGGCIRRETMRLDLGTAYIRAGTYVEEIQRTSKGNWLSWPGKLMALAAFGSAKNPSDVSICCEYMLDKVSLESAFDRFRNRHFDWCACIQRAFELVATPIFESWANKSIPLCVTGGCALNVQFNQHLRNLGFEVFVPPNPNDCGLTLGMLLDQDRPSESAVCTFNGVPWMGGEESYPAITLEETCELLNRDKIVGLIEGDSELGPRALGHRSILCRADLPYARARLNQIKGREWYRPVSPVFRRHEATNQRRWPTRSESDDGNSPFMSFARYYWQDYRMGVGSIEFVHYDNTARVQTVSAGDSLFKLVDRVGPLINTSLNLKGKPLCNEIGDALELLRTTGLDCLVVNGHLIEK